MTGLVEFTGMDDDGWALFPGLTVAAAGRAGFVRNMDGAQQLGAQGAVPVLAAALSDPVVGPQACRHENDAPRGLGGIYRALFGEERVESEGTEVAEDEKEQAAARTDGAAPAADPAAARPRTDVPVGERIRERFCRHMDRFVAEFESEAFGARCTARQLVQAAG